MTDFVGAVAQRVGRTEADVRKVLSDNGVHLYTPRSSAERLQLKRLHFSGFKDPDSRPPTMPFDFDWALTPGLNILGSSINSAGKTSVLEICRWMLTGRDRHSSGGLDPRVRAMVRHVRLEFSLGRDDVVVEMSPGRGSAPGTLTVGGTTTAFDSDTMSTALGDLMLDRLRLPPMARFTKSARTGRGALVEQAWPLYSGALIVGPTHLGAVIGTVDNEAGNLLQMYLALPWFDTLLQARNARDEITQDLRDRQAAAVAEQAVRAADTARLEEELLEAQAALDSLPTGPDLLDQLSNGVDEAGRSNRSLMLLESRLASAEADAHTAQAVRTAAQQELAAIREHTEASAYFRALQPAACPRCDQPIDAHRLAAEAAESACSVCTRANEPTTDSTALRRAEDASIETERQLKLANARVENLSLQVEEARRERAQARQDVQKIAGGTVLIERQAKVLQVERLRGRLEERGAVAAGALTAPDDSPAIQVLSGAIDEASQLVGASATGVFDELNSQLVTLGRRFGVAELTRAGLNRAAHLPVWKGETKYNFRQLSEGDRLRMKVALVVALLETAARRGVGHHPGLLLVDSPGAQEVGHAPLAEMLTSLSALSVDLDVQVVVATARLQEAVDVIGDARVRQPKPPNEHLW